MSKGPLISSDIVQEIARQILCELPQACQGAECRCSGDASHTLRALLEVGHKLKPEEQLRLCETLINIAAALLKGAHQPGAFRQTSEVFERWVGGLVQRGQAGNPAAKAQCRGPLGCLLTSVKV